MDEIVQALLTFLANVGGYGVAVIALLYVFRGGNPTVARIGTALWALFALWAICVGWYIGTEFWIDANYQTEDAVPPWLDSSNGIAENNQSEVWQVWLATLIFKHLRAPGSPESK